MATNPPPSNRAGIGALIGVVGITAAAILVPLVGQWEGKSNDPYADLIGKMTVCYGETNIEMRRYTDAECEDMLGKSLAGYAREVLICVPGLRGRPNQLAASVSLAYNIGSAKFCRSTAARRFNAGQWKAGCDAFLMWRYAGGREVKGLLNRRKAERAVCLKGVTT